MRFFMYIFTIFCLTSNNIETAVSQTNLDLYLKKLNDDSLTIRTKLELSDATAENINTKLKQLQLKYHPDKNPRELRSLTTEISGKINSIIDHIKTLLGAKKPFPWIFNLKENDLKTEALRIQRNEIQEAQQETERRLAAEEAKRRFAAEEAEKAARDKETQELELLKNIRRRFDSEFLSKIPMPHDRSLDNILEHIRESQNSLDKQYQELLNPDKFQFKKDTAEALYNKFHSEILDLYFEKVLNNLSSKEVLQLLHIPEFAQELNSSNSPEKLDQYLAPNYELIFEKIKSKIINAKAQERIEEFIGNKISYLDNKIQEFFQKKAASQAPKNIMPH